MARGQRTDLPTAATATAMGDLGYQPGEIAAATGLPPGTIDDIINGRHGWDRMQNDPVFKEYREREKRIMHTGSIEIAKKALGQIERKLPQASAAQSAMIYGILRDKERLDAGESVLNVAVIHKHEIAGLDRLASALSRALLSGKGEDKESGQD